jgi:phosphate transport system protein
MRLAKEVTRLKKKILELSAVVEESARNAVVAVVQRDAVMAGEVIDGDERVDGMEVEIEEECLKILALHQPVAIDLRYIVTVLKINNDLERIGDLAVNIAKGAIFLADHRGAETPPKLFDMTEKTRAMLHRSLDALVDVSADTAREVLALDDDIDKLHKKMFETLKAQMRENPDEIDGYMRLLTVSRNLERMADLATNIAEDVIYLIEGDIVRHGHV